jgi:hypothetical protein
VPLRIENAGRKTDITVDQTLALERGQPFRRIGVVELAAGIETILTLSNTGTDGFVILDALQLLALPE